MLTNSSCTLYRYNGIGFDRVFFSKCHWQENRAANVLKSGLQTADSVTVYISADIAGGNLTQGTGRSASKDIIVKGDCQFEFDNSSQQTVSEDLNAFRKDYPEYLTVTSIDCKLYGIKELQHIKISAR